MRVVVAMVALVAAKLATVGTPILYMWAVDGLTDPAETPIWLLTPVALVIAYGVARISSIAFAQLRDAVFAKVAQRALRRLALTTFQHVHAQVYDQHHNNRLDSLEYGLNFQTD